mmetsp:Transcript_23669/g.69730  ORF Transcript_23669/g.69730 Transcript_23669/m.69730 type:complete len:213 (-) Transcript_23669:243-881(-)
MVESHAVCIHEADAGQAVPLVLEVRRGRVHRANESHKARIHRRHEGKVLESLRVEGGQVRRGPEEGAIRRVRCLEMEDTHGQGSVRKLWYLDAQKVNAPWLRPELVLHPLAAAAVRGARARLGYPPVICHHVQREGWAACAATRGRGRRCGHNLGVVHGRELEETYHVLDQLPVIQYRREEASCTEGADTLGAHARRPWRRRVADVVCVCSI